jgi:RNA polymerase sigma factor (sigma-70 family)
METDAELLGRYVRYGDEAAFTQLVRRHVGLVYSAACREAGGDQAAAEDVTQLVFIELARKAGSLIHYTTVAGWLYTSVRHVSANRRRAQQRRILREEKAHLMNESLAPHASEPELTWEELCPVLDDAMHDLNEQDRNAVALRFLEGNSLQEVGAALGLTENAARMRVDRALEKLRARLARRGVTSTASGLALVLAAGALLSTPPAALAASTATAALAAGASALAAAGASTTLTSLALLTNVKLGIVSAIVVAGVVTLLVVQHEAPTPAATPAPTPVTRQPVMSSAFLTGAMLFSCDEFGNPAGNLVWDTRGADSHFYKIWLSRGTPRGNPDGLTGPFLNGPAWEAAPIDLPLEEGTNQFTVFYQSDGLWPTMGLNLFFNGNAFPALSVLAPGRTNDVLPGFFPNSARRTFSLTSYPSPNVRAAGTAATVVSGHPVQVIEYYHVASTNLFALDRVSSHGATNNGRLDCVVTFTLVVRPSSRRPDQAQAGLRNSEIRPR